MDKSGLFCGYKHKEQNFDSRELFSWVDKDIGRSKAWSCDKCTFWVWWEPFGSWSIPLERLLGSSLLINHSNHSVSMELALWFLKGCSTWKATNPVKFYVQATKDAQSSPSWLWTPDYVLWSVLLEAGSGPDPTEGCRVTATDAAVALQHTASGTSVRGPATNQHINYSGFDFEKSYGPQ